MSAMTMPTVTEIPLRLEAVGPDPFLAPAPRPAAAAAAGTRIAR
jgi:hypothetical protein